MQMLRVVAGTTNIASVEIRDTLHGHFVYMRNCVFCHGKRGDGRGEMGLTVEPRPRDFGAGVFKYRSTPSGTLPTNEDLTRTVREGIPDTAMPIFGKLPMRDVEAVCGRVRQHSRIAAQNRYSCARQNAPSKKVQCFARTVEAFGP
jgi:mono/diheme cytochrome c family protein